jgi:hypothetical protein
VKVLYLPLNSPAIKQTGMMDAFVACGVELKVFDFYIKEIKKVPANVIRKELIDEASNFKPDLIHMQLQFTSTIDPATLLEVRRNCPNAIMTNWTGDIRTNIPNEFIQTAKIVDISLISSTGQLEAYRAAAKARVEYWQIGFDPKLYFPKGKKTFSYDAAFTATKYVRSEFPGQADRNKTADLLRAKFGDRFGLFGYYWGHGVKSIEHTALSDLYNDSASCISVSNFNNVSHYFSDRLLLCMASGRPTISLTFPGWDSYFTDNYDIIIAKTVAEIPEKVKWVLNNPQEAEQIGLAGARTVLAEHSYHCRAKELLHMVGAL